MRKLLLALAIAFAIAQARAQTHSVTLTWAVATSSDPNVPVTAHNVYRGSVHGGPYSKIASVGGSATTYTDTSVTAGATYYYVTTGINSAGESAYSNEASATVPTDVTPPPSGIASGDILQWNGSAWVNHTPAAPLRDAAGVIEIPSRERVGRHEFDRRLAAGSICQVTPVSGLRGNGYEFTWSDRELDVRLKRRQMFSVVRFAFICTGLAN